METSVKFTSIMNETHLLTSCKLQRGHFAGNRKEQVTVSTRAPQCFNHPAE